MKLKRYFLVMGSLLSKNWNMETSKVWFITGASQGLGLILVKKLLENGYRVAATSRNAQRLKDAVGVIDSRHFLPLAVDLTNIDCINESVKQTVAVFGRIDVVVNNAGYGMTGTVEETERDDVQKIFDVNVMAAIDVTRSIIPIMRGQHSGYIINISSVAGFVGAPGWAVYSATKAAVTAFSEVLSLDLKEFGINVTVAEPSGFRTGFLTEDSLIYKKSKIGGYQAVRNAQKQYLAANGKQPGNPDKAAEILIQLSENQQPPLHLILGYDAYKRASGKLAAMAYELQTWKSVAISADFKN
jgi:short-subunit dehydrogenase